MVRRLLIVVILVMMGALFIQAAESAQKSPNPESVMIVGIRSVSNMPTVQSVRVTPGYVKNRCGTMSERSQPGRNTQPLLVLTNAEGQVIYTTEFAYPTARTIPPRPAGSLEPVSADVIPLTDPEVFLMVPYFMDTAGIEIYYPGESQPRYTSSLSALEVHYQTADPSFSARPAPTYAEERNFHIVIIASGYGAGELAKFTAEAEALGEYLLAQPPFDAYASMIRVHIYANTEDLECRDNCAGVARAMCCNGGRVITAAAASGYLCDEIIVLHNTDVYCGGGFRSPAYKQISANTYTMSSNVFNYKELVLHEFGHSFGNLCDEYTYDTHMDGYDPACVNCRSDCGAWASITRQCHMSCDNRHDFFRPQDSIMRDLIYPYFNEVSIFTSTAPHGLERRLRFFTGQGDRLYITLQWTRKEEHAWMIRMQYADLSLTVENPNDLPIAILRVFRDDNDGAGFRRLREFPASALQNDTISFRDEGLNRRVYYNYKVDALDPDGNIIGSSGALTIQ